MYVAGAYFALGHKTSVSVHRDFIANVRKVAKFGGDGNSLGAGETMFQMRKLLDGCRYRLMGQ